MKNGIPNDDLGYYEKLKNDRVGMTLFNNEGYEMELVEYNRTDDVIVKFESEELNKSILVKTWFCHFKRGQIKNPLRRSVCNVGYMDISSSDFHKLKNYGFVHETWRSMIQRCYLETELKKHPSYRGVTVCEQWHSFRNFYNWFCENYYEVEGERMHLDKDMLAIENRVYSPETCVFIPEFINHVIQKPKRSEKGFPPGVSRSGKSKFKIRYQDGLRNERIQISGFNDIESAEAKYKELKNEYIKRVAEHYKSRIPENVYEALVRMEV